MAYPPNLTLGSRNASRMVPNGSWWYTNALGCSQARLGCLSSCLPTFAMPLDVWARSRGPYMGRILKLTYAICRCRDSRWTQCVFSRLSYRNIEYFILKVLSEWPSRQKNNFIFLDQTFSLWFGFKFDELNQKIMLSHRMRKTESPYKWVEDLKTFYRFNLSYTVYFKKISVLSLVTKPSVAGLVTKQCLFLGDRNLGCKLSWGVSAGKML